MASKVNKLAWPEVSAQVIGEIVELTPHRVRQLEKDGWFEKTARGVYSAEKVFLGYIRFLKASARAGSKVAGNKQLNDAKSELVSVQVEERSGKLLKAARREAISVADEIVGELMTDLTSLSARVTRDPELRRKIEEEVERIRIEAANRSQRIAAGEEEGDPSSEATGEDAD